MVSNSATMLRFCNSMVNATCHFWANNYGQYKSEPDPTGVFLSSFIQNLLGKIISITNIYISLNKHMIDGEIYYVHYDTARIIRTMIFFDKVETAKSEVAYQVDAERLARYE